MKQFLGLMLTIVIACSVGCAGPGSNTVAGNVATGASINALADVPGAGFVGLAAMAADIISQSGKPKTGQFSPALRQHLNQSPGLILTTGKPHWVPRKEADGHVITAENAPKRSMEYKEAFVRAADKYVRGQFGDTPEMQQKNLKAWEERKTVVAEYSGPNNANLVFVSTDREPAEVMFSEEWAARNAAGAAEKSGVLKEPASAPADKPVDTKGSASNFIDKAGSLKDPNAKN